jgi:hypothetical protein
MALLSKRKCTMDKGKVKVRNTVRAFSMHIDYYPPVNESLTDTGDLTRNQWIFFDFNYKIGLSEFPKFARPS